MGSPLTSGARRGRRAVLAVAAPVVALVAACAGGEAAVTSAPPQPSRAASDPATAAPSTAVAATSPPAATEAPTSSTVEPPVGTTEAPTTTLRPLPDPSPPVPAGDNRVYVLADSVLAGAKAEVPATMTGWKVTVDAVESRFVTQGIAVLQSKVAALDRTRNEAFEKEKAAAEAESRPAPAPPAKATLVEAVGRVVVVNLCTNYQAGGGFDRWVAQYMSALASMDRVVWMTCAEWSEGQEEANAAIRAAAPSHKKMVVADWAVYADREGFTYADGIHLDLEGRAAVADLLARAVGPAPGTPAKKR